MTTSPHEASRAPKFFDNFHDHIQLVKVLAEHSPISTQIYDQDGFSVYTNQEHSKMFGGPPPPTYSVLKDNVAEAAGILPLVRRVYSGETIQSPIFWYDPRELKSISDKDAEYVMAMGRPAALVCRMVPVFLENPTGERKVSHVVFFHKDVTGEMFMQKERDDAKSLIQNILDQTRVVVYIKDLEGRFIFVNRQFCHIFNLTAAQILGKKGHELFPQDIADIFQKNDLLVQNTRTHIEAEETAIHADGSAHIYISQKFPLDDSEGKFFGVCGISTDITQYRAMERKLGAAQQMESVGLLAGGVAHNFNNIMGIILLMADTLLLKKNSAESDLRKGIQSIKDAAQQASFLTRQLLAFGRKPSFQSTVLALPTAISGMEELLRNAIGEDIQFTIDIDPTTWPIYVDPFQIEQIFMNLCLNARDAMPTGGMLSVRVRNVKLSAGDKSWRIGQPTGEFVELSVSDNGIGIDSEALDRIFEPFFTTKAAGKGTGLGLATVYGIVQMAGGDISVASAPNQGTTFRICFPKAEGLDLTLSPTLSQSAQVQIDLGSETILLVEDQGSLRHLTAGLLRESGYKVIEAKDGTAALELWPLVSKQVDLIITDIVMPDMSGIELIEKIEKINKKSVKTLFVSAYSDKKLSEYPRRPATLHFLEKPYSAFRLFTKIREALQKK